MIQKTILTVLVLLGVNSLFGQTADFSATPTVICSGGSIQFNDLSTGATTYAWTFPDGGAGQTSTFSDPIVTYNVPGTYTVTLTVTNGATSDTETKTGYITVLSAATATLTTIGADTQSICLGGFMNQVVYSVEGATNVTFSGLPVNVVGLFTPSAGGGGIVTISGPPDPPGIYPWSFTTSGTSCTPVTVNGLITVGAPNSLSLNTGPASQAACLNVAMSNIIFDVTGTPDSVIVTGLPPGVVGSFTGTQVVIAGTPSTAGSYVYTITSYGLPCPQAQFSASIDVGPSMELTSAPGSDNPTLCVNSPLGNIFYTLGPDITGATVTGLPPGITSTFNPGAFLITNTPTTVGVFNYTVTATGSPCGPISASGTITVDTVPTMVHDNPGSEIQTLCEGTSIVGISYTVGGSATGATVTGLPLGVTGTFAGGNFTISGSPSESGVFNFTVSTSGSACGQIDSLGTLTVDGMPQLTLMSAALSDSQDVCINTVMDSIIYVLSGTASDTTVMGLPSGITSTIQGDSIIITGTPNVIGVFPFMVFTAGGSCPPDTVFGQISTGNPPILTLASAAISDTQSLCSSTALDSIIYTISGAADTALATGLPAGVTQVFSGDSLIITGSPSALGTSSFTVFGQGGLCPNAEMNGLIEVFDPSINLVSPIATINQQLCINSEIDTIIYVFSGGATGATTLNLPAGLTTAIQNDSLLIFGTPTASGTFAYIAHTTGTPCEADSTYGVITVEDAPVIMLISAVGTDNQTVDEDEAITQIVYLITGTVTSPNVTGLPAGVTSTIQGDSIIITGSTSNVGVWGYGVSAIGTNCPVDTVYGAITVLEVNDTVIVPPVVPVDSTVIFVPNLFSPNGDDHNDLWEILQLADYEETHVVVINREGQVVFEDRDYLNTWDGTYNGENLPEATYYYRINIDEGEIILKGAVTILRNEK